MKFQLHTVKIIFFLFFTNLVIGQTEIELNENANKLFEKEQYVDATPKYLQLLSLNPKSAAYNFKYGTCLLFNSYHKKKALRYLSFAVKQNGIDSRAFYFYGKALHLNYQFKEAIKYYTIYREKRAKRDDRYNVERDIKMCQNGQKLLVTFTDIVVKNKKEIDQSKFFRLYDNIETVGGEILVSTEFQTKMDKKKGHVPILHFPPNAKAIYYSSYGDGDNKNIYVRRRLPNGKWGNPQLLPGKVNTLEDEDFPFLHSSGDFLFFSSKGHNSMGGYDIFMSRFDPNTNSFGKPENVDFAISSPDDDLFYVVDKTFQNAYFASSRQSQNGKLHVYNVRVARVPIREVIIMGDFLSEINPENKSMTIEVSSFTSGDYVGRIKSNKTGKYSFVFPRGGKYNYEVIVEGSGDTYKFVVELPFLDEFRPLKQKAIHTTVDGQEMVKIVNLFDEKVEGAEALIAEVIRKKAELEVNIDDFDLKELDAQENRDKILSEIGFGGMTLREVSDQLDELSLTEELKQAQVKQITSNVNNEILEKAKLLTMYETSLSDVKSRIKEATNPSEKHELLTESLRIEHEKEALIKEITHLENVKNKMSTTVLSSDGSNQMKNIENQFNQLLESDNEEGALALLIKSEEKIRKTQRQSPAEIINEMIEESIALTDDLKHLSDQLLSYEKSKNEIQSSTILLENSIPALKKKEQAKAKSKLLAQKEELALLIEMSTATQSSINAKNETLYLLDNNIASVQKAMAEENQFSNQQDAVAEVLENMNNSVQASSAVEIQNELSLLEKEYPELSPDYTEALVTENPNDTLPIQSIENQALFAQVKNNYEEQIGELNNDSVLTELEKNRKRIEVNTDFLQEIETRIIAIRSELAKNPSSKERKNEQKELNALTKELNENNEILRNEIALLENNSIANSNNSDVELTTETVLDEIEPNYIAKINRIEEDESLSEKEKLERLNEVDKDLINELTKIRKKIVKDLNREADSDDLKTKKKRIDELITLKTSEISQREQTLIAINNVSSISNEKDVQSRIAKEITEDYLVELEYVESLNSTGFEKERNILRVEKAQLDRLSEELVTTGKRLTKEPENKILIQKARIIEELEKDQITNVENQKRKAIASISAGDLEQVIIEIDENYSADIDKINQSNSSDKNKKIADREFELQEKTQTKIEQLEKEQKRRYSVTAELDLAIYEIVFQESIQREKELRKTLDAVVENTDNQSTEKSVESEKSNLSSVKNENEILIEELKSNSNSTEENAPIDAQVIELNIEKRKEIDQLELEAYTSKSEEEQDYLLEKAILKQDALNTLIATTIAEQKIQQIENKFDVQLSSEEELKKRRRNYTIRIGELITEINHLEEEIKEAKKKEKVLLVQEKKGVVAEKELLLSQMKVLEEKIFNDQGVSSFIPKQAKDKEISFNEERKMASSAEYRNYEEKAIEVLDIENQIRIIEKEIKAEKREVSHLITSQTLQDNEEIEGELKKMKELERELEILNIELIQKKYAANEKLPTNNNEAMKMQNLVYRGIKPLKIIAVATLMQMPSEGFSMNNSEVSTYSSSNPIPVDVKNPTGLVYRVQIGAFSKPIPQDLFKEFTPVSGELIKGTTVTRYMAGFFNNSQKVIDARQSIRELGYSDAFIVAYCDGERIGFGEARKREANGTCVPKGSNELMVEVATNTAKKLGIPLSNELEEVAEESYHKAPGAVAAEPIEMMQGLFFTVQIGVFNRPVSDEVVYNLPEILTVRLPNGQIRYNTGLFNSVGEALPRRKESLARGIVGAFIVAYYKGKRIPIAQAKHILANNGNGILQTEMNSKQTDKEKDTEVDNALTTRTDTVSMENLVSIEEIDRIERQRIQIVTKKEFTEFPRDVLNRYNAEGAFYYDEKDRKVKSFIYKNVDDLPRLWNFVDDIDTVYLSLSEEGISDLTTISVSIDGAIIPGDFMDWVQRTPYYHEVIETEEGLDIRFYGIEEDNLEEFITEIKTFVLSPVIMEEINEE